MCLMRMLWDGPRLSVKTKQNRRQFGDKNTPMLLVPPQPGLILMEYSPWSLQATTRNNYAHCSRVIKKLVCSPQTLCESTL